MRIIASSLRSSIRHLLLAIAVVSLAPVARADEAPMPLAARAAAVPAQNAANLAHEEVFKKADGYPSASECQACHPKQYREWSVSPHAYAQMSPIFNAMHGTVVKLTSGTAGDFCIRCHTPVGMALEEPLFTSNLKRHQVSREGVTCIVCHRINQAYGKVSGRMVVHPGGLEDVVYGPLGNRILKEELDQSGDKLTVDPDGRGRLVHGQAEEFFQLTQPSFCGTCHDVTLVNGFRLEEAFSEYKSSPSAAAGVTCQDCHMRDNKPGEPGDYTMGPAAIVAGKPTEDRPLSNHMISGPDYSIIHPGLFPHNPKAHDLASMAEWIEFDWKAGWGTDEFERSKPADMTFPERWRDLRSRQEGRKVIDEQLALLKENKERSKLVLQAGYKLGDITVEKSDVSGIEFTVEVYNGTDGHGVPTGFIAERVVFLQVTVTDGSGQTIFQSGDLDPNGDVRDLHSVYVHNGDLPLDPYLFSLQSKFITRNVRGGEREQVLAVNQSVDPLPFVRPDPSPSILLGRTLGARTHKVNIMPRKSRYPRYVVTADQLAGTRPPYQARVKLITGMVPVNLVHAIMGVGFDYGMTPREVADAVVAGHEVLWDQTIDLQVLGK